MPVLLVVEAVTVLYGTLGGHPSTFLDTIQRSGEPIERVVIYTGSASEEERKNSQKALAVVTKTLDSMRIEFDHRNFTSPRDFATILRTLLFDLLERTSDHVLFNLTGGPETITVAATVACLLLGIRVLYNPGEPNVGATSVELPVFRVRYSQVLTEKQRELLRAIHDEAPGSLDDLAVVLGKDNATITYHVQRLQELGAVKLLADPRNRLIRTPKLTPTGDIMLMVEEIIKEGREKPRA